MVAHPAHGQMKNRDIKKPQQSYGIAYDTYIVHTKKDVTQGLENSTSHESGICKNLRESSWRAKQERLLLLRFSFRLFFSSLPTVRFCTVF